MQKIKAIIWDIDGTLVDTIPLCVEAMRQAVEPLVHRSLSDEEIKATFGPTEEGSIRQLAPADYKKGMEDFLRLYKNMHDQYSQPFKDIPELLTRLQEKGIYLAVTTGKGNETTAFSLQYLGLAQFFNRVETGSAQGSRKKEAIEQIIHSLQDIGKDEVIYVGDSPGDIRESHAAGIKCIAAAWAETADKEKLLNENPDELFDSVDAVKEWVTARI